jgi:hypothetical protein
MNKCNMQHLNGFKMDDSTHVKILIVQKMWKKSINHSRTIAKHWVAHVSIYFIKCKMQRVNNNFNILKVNGLTYVHMLIIEEMWQKSLICFNINVRFLIIACVLINYGKYKMQFMNNGFSMLKVDIHVSCW